MRLEVMGVARGANGRGVGILGSKRLWSSRLREIFWPECTKRHFHTAGIARWEEPPNLWMARAAMKMKGAGRPDGALAAH